MTCHLDLVGEVLRGVMEAGVKWVVFNAHTGVTAPEDPQGVV